MKWNSHKQS